MESYNTEDYQKYISFLYNRKITEDESEKFYKGDMHVHSKYSYDSEMSLERIIYEAKKRKLEYVGIADHVDFGNEATLFVIDRLKQRNEEIDKLSEKTDIRILKGVEIGEPHLYRREMEYIQRIQDLDFVIGSIHNIKRKSLYAERNKKDLINKYYREVLKMVKEADIDIVGHLDYIKRYIEQDGLDEDLIYQILEAIHYSNKALEINTSGIRRCNESFPSNSILETYTKLGGKKITYGSDAHEECELAASIEETSKQQKIYKLSSGIYINRKFKQI